MKVSDLKNVFEAGRPLVEQWLDVAEQMAALRDACREKEIDWSQVKALLKAQIQDGRDGSSKRVNAILSKADNATSYADALGLTSEKFNSREFASDEQVTASALQKPVQQFSSPDIDLTIPDDLSVPGFLRRDGAAA